MKGYFITLEGGEGAGKTTVLQALAQALAKQGYDVLTTREPGGIKIAEDIRRVILDKAHTMMDAYTEALLYAAARRQHLVEKVIPALQAGTVVLCDRFIDSSLAYQGYARGLGVQEVLAINEFAIQNCLPQLTLYLKIDPKKGLQRITANKNRETNRLDEENLSFHQQVFAGYEYLVKQYPKRIQTIDADQSLDRVVKQSIEMVTTFLEQ